MSLEEEHKRHIIVAGGGFTGLVCAYSLLKEGYKVTLLEAAEEVGGLSTSFDFGPFRWDRFYHCILTSDRALLTLLADLGLADHVRWTPTQVGLFAHGSLNRMDTLGDLLKYPHLSLWNKARLILATLYISNLRDGTKLENVSLQSWTERLFGKAVSREMWEPLYRCKLGEMRHQASAAFLWGTLRRLYSTREKGAKKQERLGYVRGGYFTVLSRLKQQVEVLGGEICTSTQVNQIRQAAPCACSAIVVEVETNQGRMRCDGLISTAPAGVLADILETTDCGYLDRLRQVHYLGLIAVVLVLSRKLSPFYVTNITEQVSFTGVIEMTNLIDRRHETNGYHLVYLPRYTDPKDPLFTAPDSTVWEAFRPDLVRMHPDFLESDIVERFVFRQRIVQPVPTLNYSALAPPARSPVPGVYVVNTAQIINNTLNNNVMTELAEATCRQLVMDIPNTQAQRIKVG